MIYVMGREIEQEHFSAGELKIKLQPYDFDTIEISWYYENDSEFFTLACIRDFYKDKKCILWIPYFPHARMDRVKNPGDVFTLRTFCNLINSLNFNKVISCDVHSNVTPALVNNFVNESPKKYIDQAITTFGTENLALFFPDEGAMKRYGEMFPNMPQAFGIKKRNWETQKIEGYMIVGEDNIKGKKVLIIDDICSYGNTFVHAAGALLTAGAAEVNLFITHCEDAINKGELFKCGRINHVFTTSSLPRSAETEEKLYHV